MLKFARILLGALRALRGPMLPVAVDDRMSLDCPSCRAPFLCPVEWGTVDDQHWWVLSRCGECGSWTETLIDNAQAARLDVELNAQQALIRRAAERLEAERMAAEADVFIVALQRDLIDAADFA
jgi:uncharacterized Zn finger protein